MDITPPLGIGDLLILRMMDNNIKNIYISTQLIKDHRKYPDKFLKFIKKFIKNLFPSLNIIEYDGDYSNLSRIEHYNFKNTYLYDYYHFENNFNKEYDNYIVFHTKCRFDYYSHDFFNELPILENFFKNFKSKYKILLLGEKTIEDCHEKRSHNIESIYNILTLLKNNNDVTDLTYDELYSGNEYINFEKDIFIINNAVYNIGFGYGGPLTICTAFSRNNIFYVNKISHNCVKRYKELNENIKDDVNIFINTLNNLL